MPDIEEDLASLVRQRILVEDGVWRWRSCRRRVLPIAPRRSRDRARVDARLRGRYARRMSASRRSTRLLAPLLPVVAVLAMVPSASCHTTCRTFGGVGTSCAPPCTTVDDCEEGEICHVSGDPYDPTGGKGKVCTLPCTASHLNCNCDCTDSPEAGFCGALEPNPCSSPEKACRADGARQTWIDCSCSCVCSCGQAGCNDVTQQLACTNQCSEGIQKRAQDHPGCSAELDDYLFCLYQHPAKDDCCTDGKCAEDQTTACQVEAATLSSCEGGV